KYAQAEQARATRFTSSREMMGKLVPLVAGQFGIDPIQAQYGDLDTALLQPVEREQLKRSRWQGEGRARDQGTQLPVRDRSRARWRAQPSVRPTTKRPGLSAASSGFAPRAPLANLGTQLGA